jgi:carbamoyltransferase
MYILGINSAYHESAVCLLRDGAIVVAIEEERFNRKKHAKSARVDNPDEIPVNAIRYALEKAGISADQVAHVGFSIDPWRRLENKDLDELVVDGDWGSIAGEEAFFNRLMLIPDRLRDMGFEAQVTWLGHHQCHAASAFYPTPFREAAVLAVDGIGEANTTLLCYGQGTRVEMLKEIAYPNSLGFVWEKLSKFLGFGEYDAAKVMGLASYGDPRRYMGRFEQVIRLVPEGGFVVDNGVFRFRAEDYVPLENLFGARRRTREQDLAREHEDIAAALQEITNRVAIHLADYLHAQTGSRNLCLAGGVALNCVMNRVVYEESPFENLFVQPAAHDAGTALGAALFIWHSVLGMESRCVMDHAFWGPAFSDEEIETFLRGEDSLIYVRVDDIERKAAELLADGNVVGWFQGAMEFGPRALGNRTLLADPRNPGMRDILNEKVKHRESFRPFAPSVLHEEADKWFEIAKPTSASEFMLVAYPANPDFRDRIPAVVHVDGTSRIQTVRKEVNPRYHKMISEFYAMTGVPVVLNTSFNDSEPIVCTPEDAINTFKNTRIDYLAIGNYLVTRNGT